MPRHRPGSLHQSNKRFKSKHASKGALKERNSGKVERSTGGGPKHQSTAAAQQKLNRKNAARMAQQRLRQQRVDQLRIFQGRSGAPRICAVIPLCADVSASRVVNDLFNDQVRAGMDCDITSDNRHRILDLTSRFKQKLQFIELDRPHDSTFYKHFLSVLDACKVADCVLFVVSAREDVDEYGKLLITAIRAQGVPSSLAIAEHLNEQPQKKHSDIRKSLATFLVQEGVFTEISKLYAAEQASDRLNLVRQLTSLSPHCLHWREQHPYMLANSLQRSADGDGLIVTGVSRGKVPFAANLLVHLQGSGDYQLDKIVDHTEGAGECLPVEGGQEPLEHEQEPDPMDREQTWPTEEELVEAERRLQESARTRSAKVRVPKGTSSYQAAWIEDSDEVNLDDEVSDFDYDGDEIVEDGNGEDDYSGSEMGEDDYSGSEMGEDDYSGSEMGEDDYSGSEMGEGDYSGSEMGEGDYNSQDEKSGDDDQFEQVELEGRAGAAHNDDYDAEDSDREAADIDRYLAERKEHNEASSRDRCRQLRENLEFPDEIDTPADQPARERFQKYRGLQSFRTSSWDSYENLPLDYGRIVEFADFQKTRRQVLQSVLAMAKSSTNGRQMECQMERPAHVPPGHLISLHIRKVPEETIQAALLTAANSRPFVVFGLLPHEQKMSVVNFSCTRPKSTIFGSGEDAAIESNDESSMAINDAGDGDGFFNDQQPIVKSKDLLLIFCGFRRFHNRPIYSQNSGGSKQLHKYEEFLHTGTTSIGTMFAPVTFPPAPVTMFTLPSGKTGGDLPQFVGYGSVLRVDPARMIIKRRILTGHPTRIHKSSHRHTAVVKFMFFDPLDVEYFKPVELKTKYGRRGHIMDSVGTHGTMKCSFDRQLQQQDTVCLMLYKRVYPKWPVGGYKSLFADVERVE